MSTTAWWQEQVDAVDAALAAGNTDEFLRLVDRMITTLSQGGLPQSFQTNAVSKLITSRSLAMEVPPDRVRAYFHEKVRPQLPV